MPVADVKQMYRDLGASIFEKTYFQEWRLGQRVVRTDQPEVSRPAGAGRARRATRRHDDARQPARQDRADLVSDDEAARHRQPVASSPIIPAGDLHAAQDGKLFLTQVVRASTAAPTFFEPRKSGFPAGMGPRPTPRSSTAAFSPFNNTALQLLMLAALDGHGFRWKTGKDRLLLISVGAGSSRETFTTAQSSR